MKTIQLSLAFFYFLFIQSIKDGFKKTRLFISYKLKSAFYSVINFRKSLKFKKYERVLEEALYKEELSQADLMITIKNRIKNFYPKGVSDYIPLSWKQKREIKAAIEFEYGDQMAKYKVKLNKNLKFV
jgi:hypothetical protein